MQINYILNYHKLFKKSHKQFNNNILWIIFQRKLISQNPSSFWRKLQKVFNISNESILAQRRNDCLSLKNRGRHYPDYLRGLDLFWSLLSNIFFGKRIHFFFSKRTMYRPPINGALNFQRVTLRAIYFDVNVGRTFFCRVSRWMQKFRINKNCTTPRACTHDRGRKIKRGRSNSVEIVITRLNSFVTEVNFFSLAFMFIISLLFFL